MSVTLSPCKTWPFYFKCSVNVLQTSPSYLVWKQEYSQSVILQVPRAVFLINLNPISNLLMFQYRGFCGKISNLILQLFQYSLADGIRTKALINANWFGPFLITYSQKKKMFAFVFKRIQIGDLRWDNLCFNVFNLFLRGGHSSPPFTSHKLLMADPFSSSLSAQRGFP